MSRLNGNTFRLGKNLTTAIIDVLLLTGLVAFLMVYFDIRYLFYNTVVAGGDTASWHGIAHHLAHVLLPENRLTGWDMGNFCGYPNFNFYFLPPFLFAVLPSYLFNIPLTITLKWVIMSGLFLFPVAVYSGLRNMNYRFPTPIIGAAGAVLFLFNETYTMFGANSLSTFAGEFCYMFAFSLFALFIGTFYGGAKDGKWALGNGILLGFIGLSHLFVFIPALILCLCAYFQGTRLRYLLWVGLTGFILMAFWILPLIAFRHPYTTPVYMIWQDFVNLRYTLAGILILILFVGPRFAIHIAVAKKNNSLLRDWSFLFLTASGAFAAAYLLGAYLSYGKDLWVTGLNLPNCANAVIPKNAARVLASFILPFSTALSAVVLITGAYFRRIGSFIKFCRLVGSFCFSTIIVLACVGLHVFISRTVPDTEMRKILMNPWMIGGIYGGSGIASTLYLGFSRQFGITLTRVAERLSPQRFLVWFSLVLGCGVAYFSAHFLQVPDIRFLPPMSFGLLCLLLADTLGPFIEEKKDSGKIMCGLTVCYLVIIAVTFGAQKSSNWYRFNNKGYQFTSGFKEFSDINRYLKTVYDKNGLNPLNAPRVAYEKCDMYGRYGGDRVFESLPFFAGRQTLEGIHYAGSIASRFMAFIQTEFSRDIKTPKPQILSKINPEALPAHFDLYNISQVIVATDTAKKALSGSRWFKKEAQFGNLALFRYISCTNRYVDVPRVRPVLYTGKQWVDDFFSWYKYPDRTEVLLVPEKYVNNVEDRAVFSGTTDSVVKLDTFRQNRLDRNGIRIDTHLEHLQIRFATNKIGIPHLIKVSYFPNWEVEGANGVYPVSPHLMMVIPRKNTVILTYQRSIWERIGLLITCSGIVILAGIWTMSRIHRLRKIFILPIKKRLDRISDSLERFATGGRVFSFGLAMVIAVSLIISGAVLRNKPVRDYIEGYHAYEQGVLFRKERQSEQATASFKKAIDIMKPLLKSRTRSDHRDIINAMLLTAMCYENLNDTNAAETWYQILIREYPYSRYLAEGYVKLARIYKNKMIAQWRVGIDRLKTGFDRKGQQARMKGLDFMERSLACYQEALQKDAFSTWVDYAGEDLKREQKRFQGLKTTLLSLPDDPEIRQRLEIITARLDDLLVDFAEKRS